MRTVIRGLAAGAAGTTALNAVTYLDMLARARPASTTPENVVRRSIEEADPTALSATGPRSDDADNRRSALGALLGMGTGAGAGIALALLKGAYRRRHGAELPAVWAVVFSTVLANAGSVLPAWALGITDPRDWTADSWLSDLLPHLAYGVSTASALSALDNR